MTRSSRLTQAIWLGLRECLHRDFCPWANSYVYWLKQPIGWLVMGLFASLLTALFVSPHAWSIVASLAIVAIAGVVWPWAAIRAVRVELTFHRRACYEGERVRATLAINNQWPLPIWGMFIEQGFVVDAGGEDTPVIALASVPGWSKSNYVFEFRPTLRGVYPLETLQLVNGFPFGVWCSSRPVVAQRELLVWPAITPLRSVPMWAGEIEDVIGPLRDRPGFDGDMIGARPFQQGDRLRSIHWAQTARRDAFIVTERQSPSRRQVIVMCDESAFPTEQRELLETAIRVAASIARELHAHHVDVRFVIGQTDLMLGPGVGEMQRLLDALARHQTHATAAALPTGASGTMKLLITAAEGVAQHVTDSNLRIVAITAGDDASQLRTPWLAVDSTQPYGASLVRQWEHACHDVAH